MARRDIVGGAIRASLASDITSTSTSIPLAASPGATGWPTGTNGEFLVCINRGLADEEKILVLSRASLTLTCASTAKRGVDGTTAQSHLAGATVEHIIGAIDADEANLFVNSPGLVADITTSTAGDTASAGVLAKWARADHKHARGDLATPPAAFTLRTSTPMTLLTTIAAAVDFDSEFTDTANGHSTAVNPSRYTIPTGFAGTWLFTATISFVANATGQRTVIFRVGGSAQRSSEAVDATAAGVTNVNIAGIIGGLVVGDYIEVVATQNSGGNLATVAANSYFSGVYLRS